MNLQILILGLFLATTPLTLAVRELSCEEWIDLTRKTTAPSKYLETLESTSLSNLERVYAYWKLIQSKIFTTQADLAGYSEEKLTDEIRENSGFIEKLVTEHKKVNSSGLTLNWTPIFDRLVSSQVLLQAAFYTQQKEHLEAGGDEWVDYVEEKIESLGEARKQLMTEPLVQMDQLFIRNYLMDFVSLTLHPFFIEDLMNRYDGARGVVRFLIQVYDEMAAFMFLEDKGIQAIWRSYPNMMVQAIEESQVGKELVQESLDYKEAIQWTRLGDLNSADIKKMLADIALRVSKDDFRYIQIQVDQSRLSGETDYLATLLRWHDVMVKKVLDLDWVK